MRFLAAYNLKFIKHNASFYNTYVFLIHAFIPTLINRYGPISLEKTASLAKINAYYNISQIRSNFMLACFFALPEGLRTGLVETVTHQEKIHSKVSGYDGASIEMPVFWHVAP
jgi:hypothetical protein